MHGYFNFSIVMWSKKSRVMWYFPLGHIILRLYALKKIPQHCGSKGCGRSILFRKKILLYWGEKKRWLVG